MSESTWKDAWDDACKVPEDAFKNLPAKLAPLIRGVTNGLNNHITMVFTPKWKRNWESAMNVVRLAFAQLQISINFILNRMTTKLNNLGAVIN